MLLGTLSSNASAAARQTDHKYKKSVAMTREGAFPRNFPAALGIKKHKGERARE